MIEIATGTLTVLDGDAMNPVGFAAGFLVFGRRDRTLGVVPFDPARTRSLRDVIPVPDTPVTRSAGGANADLSAAGDLVYVRTIQNQRLAFLDTHGRAIREIEETRTFKNPRVSPDGRWIVMNEQLLSGNIFGDLWLQGVASGELRRLTNGSNASSPEWTPDGRIVYSQLQLTGPTQAWVVSIDGTGPGEKFISLPTPVIHTVISSDGRYAVVTTETAQNKRDIYSIDLKGDHPPVPLMNSRFNETTPSISPNGHWLAYVSDETDQEEVYVRPFPVGSGRVQISLGGGGEPRWSKDGQSIVYRRVSDFAKAHLAIGPSIRVTEREELFSGVYRSAEFAGTREFDLFADGTIVALKNAETEVVVVTNWIAELKAKLAKK